MIGASARQDGRLAAQLRPVKLTTDYLLTAEGSVVIDVGHTRVLCAATIEDGVPAFLRGKGSGWVTAEYSMLPRATISRTPREAAKGRQSGRTLEIQRLIGRSLRAVTDMALLGERTLTLDCDVLQADGGTRTAAITGAYVAMAIAIQKLLKAGVLKKTPIRDAVAATSVGILKGQPILDLCYEEDSTAEVDFNVVMNGPDAFVEVQGTAEGKAYSRASMDGLIDLAREGILRLFEAQTAALATLG